MKRQRPLHSVILQQMFAPPHLLQNLARQIQPVLCGSGREHIGIQPLLDAVTWYLPCPLDRPPVADPACHPVGQKPGHALDTDSRQAEARFREPLGIFGDQDQLGLQSQHNARPGRELARQADLDRARQMRGVRGQDRNGARAPSARRVVPRETPRARRTGARILRRGERDRTCCRAARMPRSSRRNTSPQAATPTAGARSADPPDDDAPPQAS